MNNWLALAVDLRRRSTAILSDIQFQRFTRTRDSAGQTISMVSVNNVSMVSAITIAVRLRNSVRHIASFQQRQLSLAGWNTVR